MHTLCIVAVTIGRVLITKSAGQPGKGSGRGGVWETKLMEPKIPISLASDHMPPDGDTHISATPAAAASAAVQGPSVRVRPKSASFTRGLMQVSSCSRFASSTLSACTCAPELKSASVDSASQSVDTSSLRTGSCMHSGTRNAQGCSHGMHCPAGRSPLSAEIASGLPMTDTRDPGLAWAFPRLRFNVCCHDCTCSVVEYAMEGCHICMHMYAQPQSLRRCQLACLTTILKEKQ